MPTLEKVSIMIHILFLLFSLAAFAEFKPLSPELTEYPYPFEVSYHEVKFPKSSYRMAYMLVSPKKVKSTVLLLHGKNFSGHYWEKTAKELLKEGYRLLIPDQIGFGKSSKPESFPYSFHLLASLTHEILQKHSIKKYSVIGHSMGGMLATRMALMYPEEVEKLLLVNPIGLEDWKTMVPYKDVRAIYQEELKKKEDDIRNYQKNVYFDGKWNKEYEKGIEVLVGWTLHPAYERIAWNAALTSQMIFTEPVVYEFKNLKMPTLLLLGTRDRTAIGKAWASEEVKPKLGRYDQLGKTVIKSIPKGKLVELEGVGHMPQVEAFERYIKEVKDYLKK